jgi:hypothetical protein
MKRTKTRMNWMRMMMKMNSKNWKTKNLMNSTMMMTRTKMTMMN